MSETQEKMSNERAEKLNRQACEMVSVFFKELASFSADDIYKIASAEKGAENEHLLESINRVFKQFIENGDELPRIYFDSYERTVDQFVHTFKVNIKGKAEENVERLVAKAVGKELNEISHTDIAKAIMVSNIEEETPKEMAEAPEVTPGTGTAV